MSDLEPTLVADRLHRLADRITPELDVVGQVRAARERHTRQRRRQRMALLTVATATAALAVAVPLGLGALSSSAPGGDVAGPGGTSDPRRTLQEQRQDAEQTLLEARAAELTERFEARGTSLSLTAPVDLFLCPDDAAAMSDVLGVRLSHVAGPLPADSGCVWTSGASGPGLSTFFNLEIGFNRSWIEQDIDHPDVLEPDCEKVGLPDSTPPATLVVCSEEALEHWRLFVPDTSGRGVWSFMAAVGQEQPVTGPAALAAAVGLAAENW